jgi:hypothetical protein
MSDDPRTDDELRRELMAAQIEQAKAVRDLALEQHRWERWKAMAAIGGFFAAFAAAVAAVSGIILGVAHLLH